MNPTAKYFDGKSSKPHEVKISHQAATVHIMGEAGINRFWSLQINRNFHATLVEAILSQQNNVAQSYQRLQGMHPVKLVLGSSLLIIGTVFLYLQYISPWVGEKAVHLIPQSVEINMGKSIANNFISMAEVDTAKSEQLQAFFTACGYTSDYPVHLTYLTGDVVNAFAAPGGQIVVYEDMLQLTESSDELAGLLAHELAHVNQRHSMKNLAKSLSSYLVFSVLTGDVAGISGVILENANNISEMANSRAFEREADEVGLQYMMDNQVNPQGMVGLFEQLLGYSSEQKDSLLAETETILDSLPNVPKNIDKYLEILSTHPTSEQRIEYLTALLQEKNYQVEESVARDSLWLLLKDN